MAGDVNKIEPPAQPTAHVWQQRRLAWPTNAPMTPVVTRKILRRISPLHPRSVQPRCATRKPSRSNSCAPPASSRNASTSTTARRSLSTATTTPSRSAQDPNYGTHRIRRVWVMQEFKNSEANHLGIALPKGRLRFYRRDTDGHLEFIGENSIDHTPKDETHPRLHRQRLRPRRRTQTHQLPRRLQPALDGRVLRDQCPQPQERTGERSASSSTSIAGTTGRSPSSPTTSARNDAQTIEFPVTVEPDGEAGGHLHRALFVVRSIATKQKVAQASCRQSQGHLALALNKAAAASKAAAAFQIPKILSAFSAAVLCDLCV